MHFAHVGQSAGEDKKGKKGRFQSPDGPQGKRTISGQQEGGYGPQPGLTSSHSARPPQQDEGGEGPSDAQDYGGGVDGQPEPKGRDQHHRPQEIGIAFYTPLPNVKSQPVPSRGILRVAERDVGVIDDVIVHQRGVKECVRDKQQGREYQVGCRMGQDSAQCHAILWRLW